MTSKSGKSSVGSSTSSAGRARAKAEAAKIRAQYATKQLQLTVEAANIESEKMKREAELQFEKAKVEAELEALKVQCEADAAVREAQVLEMADLQIEDEVQDPEQENKMKRTSEYVQAQNAQKQSQSHRDQEYEPETHQSLPDEAPKFSQSSFKRDCEENDDTYLPIATTEKKEDKRTYNVKSERDTYQNNQPYNPRHFNVHAPPFTSHKDPAVIPAAAMDPLAQYLARRDLTNSGLYQFDDKPENYRAWYASFTSTTNDIGLSDVQLLDLMIKWLGKESCEYVKRIRAVYVGNPSEALNKAWERLEECYAAPEIIEKSLFERLDNFPKLSTKDNIKLRELGDLLTEILGSKEDGYLTGLSYLDTSRGISPIVSKLPFGLQEKWLSSGSKYKEENKGHFPPFQYFCDFVCHEAKKRNNPSFTTCGAVSFSKQDRPIQRKNFNERTITVQKTDIASMQSGKTTKIDPAKTCPLHNKPLSLQSCKAFRNKVIEDRKAFLKKNGICFKCCASTAHLAKDCKASVKCEECESTYHVTTMHPSKPSQAPKDPPSPQADGGEAEGTNTDTPVVSSSCTEVCGNGQFGCSCTKICLAKIYPKNAEQKVINAYVIIDGQSNRSLAKPEFFNLFGITTEPSSYQLRTCSGLAETSGRRAEGFMIELVLSDD